MIRSRELMILEYPSKEQRERFLYYQYFIEASLQRKIREKLHDDSIIVSLKLVDNGSLNIFLQYFFRTPDEPTQILARDPLAHYDLTDFYFVWFTELGLNVNLNENNPYEFIVAYSIKSEEEFRWANRNMDKISEVLCHHLTAYAPKQYAYDSSIRVDEYQCFFVVVFQKATVDTVFGKMSTDFVRLDLVYALKSLIEENANA